MDTLQTSSSVGDMEVVETKMRDTIDYSDILGDDLNEFISDIMIKTNEYDHSYGKPQINKLAKQLTSVEISTELNRDQILKNFGETEVLDSISTENDKYMAFGTSQGFILIFKNDKFTNVIGANIEELAAPVSAVKFLNETIIIAGRYDGTITTYDVNNGSLLGHVKLSDSMIVQLNIIEGRKGPVTSTASQLEEQWDDELASFRYESDGPEEAIPENDGYVDVEEDMKVPQNHWLLFASDSNEGMGFITFYKPAYTYQMLLTKIKSYDHDQVIDPSPTLALASTRISASHYLVAYANCERMVVLLIEYTQGSPRNIKHKTIYVKASQSTTLGNNSPKIPYLTFNPFVFPNEEQELLYGDGNHVHLISVLTMDTSDEYSDLIDWVDFENNDLELEDCKVFFRHSYLMNLHKKSTCVGCGWIDKQLLYTVIDTHSGGKSCDIFITSQGDLDAHSQHMSPDSTFGTKKTGVPVSLDLSLLKQHIGVANRNRFDTRHIFTEYNEIIEEGTLSNYITVKWNEQALCTTRCVFDVSSKSLNFMTGQYLRVIEPTRWKELLSTFKDLSLFSKYSIMMYNGRFTGVLGMNPTQSESSRHQSVRREICPHVSKFVQKELQSHAEELQASRSTETSRTQHINNIKICFKLLVNIESSHFLFTTLYNLFLEYEGGIELFYEILVEQLNKRSLGDCHLTQVNYILDRAIAEATPDSKYIQALLNVKISNAVHETQEEIIRNAESSRTAVVQLLISRSLEEPDICYPVYIQALLKGTCDYKTAFSFMLKRLNDITQDLQGNRVKEQTTSENLLLKILTTASAFGTNLRTNIATLEAQMKHAGIDRPSHLKMRDDDMLKAYKKELKTRIEAHKALNHYFFVDHEGGLFPQVCKYIPYDVFFSHIFALLTNNNELHELYGESDIEEGYSKSIYNFVKLLVSTFDDIHGTNETLYTLQILEDSKCELYLFLAKMYSKNYIKIKTVDKILLERIFIYLVKMKKERFSTKDKRQRYMRSLLSLSNNLLYEKYDDLIALGNEIGSNAFEAQLFSIHSTTENFDTLLEGIGRTTNYESLTNNIELIISFHDKTKIAYDYIVNYLERCNDKERKYVEQSLYIFVQKLLEGATKDAEENGTTMERELDKRSIVFNWDFHKHYVALLANIASRKKSFRLTLYKYITDYYKSMNLTEALEICNNIPETKAFLFKAVNRWDSMLQNVIIDLVERRDNMISTCTMEEPVERVQEQWLERLALPKTKIKKFDLFMYQAVRYRRDGAQQHQEELAAGLEDDVRSMVSRTTGATLMKEDDDTATIISMATSQAPRHMEAVMKRQLKVTFGPYEIDKTIEALMKVLDANPDLERNLEEALQEHPDLDNIELFDFNRFCTDRYLKPRWMAKKDIHTYSKISPPDIPLLDDASTSVSIISHPAYKNVHLLLERINDLYMDGLGRSKLLPEEKMQQMWFQILLPCIEMLRKLRYGFLGKRAPEVAIQNEAEEVETGEQTIEEIQDEINECFEDIDEIEEDIVDLQEDLKEASADSSRSAEANEYCTRLQERIQEKKDYVVRKRSHIDDLQKMLKIVEENSVRKLSAIHDTINNPSAPQHMNLFANVWCQRALFHMIHTMVGYMSHHVHVPRIVQRLLLHFEPDEYYWLKNICLQLLLQFEFKFMMNGHALNLVSLDSAKVALEFYAERSRGAMPRVGDDVNKPKGTTEIIYGVPCKICKKPILSNSKQILLFHCRSRHAVHKECYIESKKGKNDPHKREGHFSCPICVRTAADNDAPEMEQRNVILSEEEREIERLKEEEKENKALELRKAAERRKYLSKVAAKTQSHQKKEKMASVKAKLSADNIFQSQTESVLKKQLQDAEKEYEESPNQGTYKQLKEAQLNWNNAVARSRTPFFSVNNRIASIQWQYSDSVPTTTSFYRSNYAHTTVETKIQMLPLDDDLMELISP